MTSFWDADKESYLAFLTAKDVVNSLTLIDVKNFLESLGVEQIVMNEEKQYLICPTICHNPIHDAASMKLYWYHNNKIFRCYTECNEAMSIFKLYQKYMELNHYSITLEDAENYVKQFLTHIHIASKKSSSFLELKEKYDYNEIIPSLKIYPKTVLDCFSKYYHPLWLKDGITKDVMDKFQIKFSIAQNKIIIPHFDINGNLVGIRARALEENDIKEFGKYRPVQIGDTLYAHPLHFNLYGIYEHQSGIKKRRCAIIAEGEKSVMLDDGYYGEYSNTVACCGSNINKYHINLLTNILGANEIVIAFDKEYDQLNSEKANQYRNKIEQICKKYINQASFSYIWDYNNLLKEKDSPFDRGKDVFEYLFITRVRVR